MNSFRFIESAKFVIELSLKNVFFLFDLDYGFAMIPNFLDIREIKIPHETFLQNIRFHRSKRHR